MDSTLRESILDSIKKLLGITQDYDYFDADIIIFINTALAILDQLALNKSYYVTGSSETWADYVGSDEEAALLKSYVYLKVKLLFDQTLNSSVVASMESMISELEFRINAKFDEWVNEDYDDDEWGEDDDIT